MPSGAPHLDVRRRIIDITIVTSVIAGLIIISIGLSIKIASLLHQLKLSNKENENIRKKYTESNERQIQQISNLKKEISGLNEKHKSPPKKRRIISPGINIDDL